MNIMPIGMSHPNFRQVKQNVSFGFVGTQIPKAKLADVAEAVVKLKLLETIENFVCQMKESTMVSDHVKYYLKKIDDPKAIGGEIYTALLELTPGHSEQNPLFRKLINCLNETGNDSNLILEELSRQLKEAYKIS